MSSDFASIGRGGGNRLLGKHREGIVALLHVILREFSRIGAKVSHPVSVGEGCGFGSPGIDPRHAVGSK